MKIKRKIIVSVVFLLFSIESFGQVNVQDSLALVDIYYATNGSNWVHNTNWLTTPVKYWFGIQLSSDSNRVREVSLNSNNLVGNFPLAFGQLSELNVLELGANSIYGSLPESFCNLNKLSYLELRHNNLTGYLPECIGDFVNLWGLYLGNNQFEGAFPDTIKTCIILTQCDIKFNHFSHFPNFSYPPPWTGSGWHINNNNFTFADLEQNNFIVPGTFIYSPQDSVRETIDTTVLAGSSLILHSKVEGTANLYLWNKNGVDIPGTTDTTLVFSSITLADSGVYSCTINNTIVTGLTLYRKLTHVHVVDTTTGILPYISVEDQFYCYLNPANRTLTLNYRFSGSKRTKSTIFNFQGQEVMRLYHGDIHERELVYDVSKLETGLYVVKVDSGTETFIRKVMIR
jgi:hypothetical protein